MGPVAWTLVLRVNTTMVSLGQRVQWSAWALLWSPSQSFLSKEDGNVGEMELGGAGTRTPCEQEGSADGGGSKDGDVGIGGGQGSWGP